MFETGIIWRATSRTACLESKNLEPGSALKHDRWGQSWQGPVVDFKKSFRKRARYNTDRLRQDKGNVIGLEVSRLGTKEAGEWVQSGREFSTQEIREIRETVAWLPGLARKELAATVCE